MSFGSCLFKLPHYWAAWLALGVYLQPAYSASFDLPSDGSTVVGQVRRVLPENGNTLLDIGRHFDLGYAEMEQANPGTSVWTPQGPIVAPTQFILPPKPWTGIVVNIPQRRLFYFPTPVTGQAPKVITYPISIAQVGWSTPLGATRIVAKYQDPAWFVPKSIQAQHSKEDGVAFPTYFPPGPDNPMGMLALETSLPGIFIHGTNHPWGVGLRASHGCMHLYPEDAANLFPLVKVGTAVRVINAPVLIGNLAGYWVMSTFPLLNEYPNQPSLDNWVHQSLMTLTLAPDRIAMDRVAALIANPEPIPVELNINQPSLAEKLDTIAVEPFAYAPYGADANAAQVPSEVLKGAQ